MKKLVFALEVFSIIAVFFMYVVLEINHEPTKGRNAISHQVVPIEKSPVARQVAVKLKGQDILPFPQRLIIAFLKIPS